MNTQESLQLVRMSLQESQGDEAMEWIDSPESSNIVRFRYEAAAQELFVEFKKGGVYQYFDVPQAIFDQMKAAPSKGAFLAQVVKGTYRYART
jgi:hypothetical protein